MKLLKNFRRKKWVDANWNKLDVFCRCLISYCHKTENTSSHCRKDIENRSFCFCFYTTDYFLEMSCCCLTLGQSWTISVMIKDIPVVNILFIAGISFMSFIVLHLRASDTAVMLCPPCYFSRYQGVIWGRFVHFLLEIESEMSK